VSILTAVKGYATVEHFYNSIEGALIASGSSITVQDDKYGTSLWSRIQKNEKALDIVTLQLDEDTALFIKGNHTFRVDVMITRTTATGTQDSVAKTLVIHQDTGRGKAFNFRSSFEFVGGYIVKTRIIMTWYDGMITSSFPKAFMLSTDIYITRVYKFNCDSLLTAAVPTFGTTNQRIKFNWNPPMVGADEYDLEYTFYDSASTVSLLGATCGSCHFTDFGFLFNGNATRVTLDTTVYHISSVFNPGYIIYRVRPVHYDTLGNRIEGRWTSDTGSTKSESSFFGNYGYHWSGHMNAFNWQYTAAFAEEGKRKEVTSYFDGTLRNRQSVTLNNTTNKAIIGETMYDHQGRASITTLPVPVDTGKIWFYNKFNVNTSGQEYSRHDFDTGNCSFIPPPMDSINSGLVATGSYGYYSSANPDKGIGFDAYLPDAVGYAFTQTEYTPDNTGRISRQSIAGKPHTLGSGHETQYFYGKPAQEQLDRLFGSEVGNNSHYLENMVIDANGQISVSYVDANGKTVATALAGQPPSNLHALPSYYSATNLYINLLDEGANQLNSTTVNSSFGLIATNSGRYHFTYKLYPGNYTDSSCSSHVCTDCLYDIALQVSGSCGCDSCLKVKLDSNFTLKNKFDTLCGTNNLTDTFSLYLTPGEYNISRQIGIDPTAMSFYENEYMRKNTCIKTYSSFLTSAIAKIDMGGCNITCATCLSSLGTSSAFLTKYITEIQSGGGTPVHQDTVTADSLYTVEVANCNNLCALQSPCQSLYNEMLADVTLGGQYNSYIQVNGLDTAVDPTSMIANGVYAYPSTYYFDANGNYDSVVVNGAKVRPNQLSENEFILNWKPSWAASFLRYHPEYCAYQYCSATNSAQYDQSIENTSRYDSAYAEGYINPMSMTGFPYTIHNSDPWWSVGGYWGGGSLTTALQHKMAQYATLEVSSSPPTYVTLSMWATAALMSYCSEDTLTGTHLSSCYSPSDTVFGGSCAGVNNMQWEIFRGLYLSMKQHAYDSMELVLMAANGCDTCIGKSDCGNYAHKQPRVVTPSYASTLNFTPGTITRSSEATFVAQQEKNNCDTMCNSYANSWLNKLNGCGTLTTAQKDSLINGFVEICEAGCGPTHYLGASTMKGGLPDSRGDISFEDVIMRVLGRSDTSSLCNGMDITMPPPYYDSNGITGPMVTYYKPSSCQCSNINNAYTVYHADSAGETKYKNFGDYLTKYYGDSISAANAYALKSLCNGSCFYATTPIQMPLWMSCCESTMPSHEEITNNAFYSWTSKPNLGSGKNGRAYDVSFTIGRFAFVGAGQTDNSIPFGGMPRDFHKYYNGASSWSAIADYPWQGGAIENVAFSLDGKGYVGMGLNDTSGTWWDDDSLRSYDTISGAWKPVCKLDSIFLKGVRRGSFSFVVGDTAYVGGGADSLWAPIHSTSCPDPCVPTSGVYSSPSHFYKDLYRFDTTSKAWRRRANYPGKGSTGMISFTIGNYGYVGCGYGKITSGGTSNYPNGEHNDLWRYNPALNKWDSMAPIPNSDSGIIGAVGFTLKGMGYVYGGEYVPASATNAMSGKFLTTLWQYNPIYNTWRRIEPTSSPAGRAFGVSFVLGNKAFYATGADGTGVLDLEKDNYELNVDTTTSLYATPHCCIGCLQIDNAITAFGTLYPHISSTSANYQTMLESYLNQTFGYNLTYAVYDSFYRQCAVDTLVSLHDGANLPLELCNRAMNEVPRVDTDPCYTYLMMDASYNAQNAYTNYIDSVQTTFSANYLKHCMNIADSFNLLEPFDEYHYTLYYYDQAENLVKTIPPQGVHPITSSSEITSIDSNRLHGNPHPKYPVDSMSSRYWFNTLNSPVAQKTPDGDTTRFWYDRLGRLVLSQNKVQKVWSFYSYTLYDAIGRIIEVGQLQPHTDTAHPSLPGCYTCSGCTVDSLYYAPVINTRNDAALKSYITTGTRTQVTHTYYDTVEFPTIPLAQQNLRKRISSITYEDVYSSTPGNYDNALHYNYDIEGNVATILTDNKHETNVKQQYKRLDYYYDLVSGRVNELIFQHDSADQFIHIYEYDADSRITDVYTSHDSIYFEHDAGYEYYDHGPLAREIIGQRQVQGRDYAYTLNGWLKGVNSSILNPTYDMGHDGDTVDANRLVARDALGFTLEYFNGDYRAIGSSKFEAYGLPDTSLYNGNIAGATYSIKTLTPKTIGYKYTYDQLGRLNDLIAFTAIDTVNDKWNSPSPISSFQERITYDENGNIFKYVRHGNTIAGMSLAMDSLNYHYKLGTNQTTNINDAVSSGNYPNDIDNEPSTHNYVYNSIGQLAKDSAGSLDTIIWTAYNKIKKVVKYNNDSLVFEYDPLGDRTEKRFYPHSGMADTTLYVRDAQGNILATYDRRIDTVRLTEWDINGAKHIGTVDTLLRVYPKLPITSGGSIDSMTITYLENQKQYELDNLLGNVFVTMSDKKIPIDTAGGTWAKYYLPNIVSANDYYAFGAMENGRTYQISNDSSYRYGLNGQEKDNQIQGQNIDYTATDWEFSSWTRQRWNMDPVNKPNESPYSVFNDNPNLYSDPTGESGVGPGGKDPDATAPIESPPLKEGGKPSKNNPVGQPEKQQADFNQTKPASSPDLHLSKQGIQKLKNVEGFVGYVYSDADKSKVKKLYKPGDKGNPTIAYGHALTTEERKEFAKGEGSFAKYTPENPMDKTTGSGILEADVVTKGETPVKASLGDVAVKQNQFDAVVIQTFNGAAGQTLYNMVKSGEVNEKVVKQTFEMYAHDRKTPSNDAALKKRADQSADIYLNGYNKK
jgi:YD repeat-containing protein